MTGPIWERVRIGWAATVGTAVGLLLSALLFGPRGIQSWHPAEWKNGLIAGILFYLSTPIREAIVGRPLRGWLGRSSGREALPAGAGRPHEGLLNGIVGFCVFGLVDIVGHMFAEGAPAAIDPERLALLFLPFVVTFAWVWGAQVRPSRAAWFGAVVGALVAALPLSVVIIADPASPLWAHRAAGLSVPFQLTVVLLLAFATGFGILRRRRICGWPAVGGALLIAAVVVLAFAGAVPFVEFGYRESMLPLLVFMALLGALGGLGGAVIDRASDRRVTPALAGVILGVLSLWAFVGFSVNPTSPGDLLSIPVTLALVVLVIWGLALRRGGLRFGISLVALLVGVTAAATLYLPQTVRPHLFAWMNVVMAALGWGVGLIVYPAAERAFRAAERQGRPGPLAEPGLGEPATPG